MTVTQPTSTGPTASIDPSQTTDLGYTGVPSKAISTVAAVLQCLGLGLLVAAHASGPKRNRRSRPLLPSTAGFKPSRPTK